MSERPRPVEEEPKSRAEQQANWWVEQYVTDQITRAMARAEAERCGDGCGCPKCAVGSVNDLNLWISWLSMGENPKYEYRYDPNRRKILRPDEE